MSEDSDEYVEPKKKGGWKTDLCFCPQLAGSIQQGGDSLIAVSFEPHLEVHSQPFSNIVIRLAEVLDCFVVMEL
jgi:hypothetical protein